MKICGLTRAEDVALGEAEGADLLGFIFTDSPRRASIDLVKSLGETRAQKIAVVVCKGDHPKLPHEVIELKERGLIDAVQFHGDEAPDACFPISFPYYKALRVKDSMDIGRIEDFRCPRVLIDAFHESSRGGTGKRIDGQLVEEARSIQPLWIAGGLNPDNLGEVLALEPELIDAASGLESAPGKKDHEKLRRFLWASREITR